MRSISLTSAVLLSINIIIGAGLFINPSPLTHIIQGYGYMAYLLSALILLPLILCIAELATIKPTAGGLYVYAHDFISPMAGFISGWCYFLGKSTSAAILAYTFSTFAQIIFLSLQNIPTKILTIMVLFFLALINMSGVKIGGRIQWLFISLKTIPIGLVLLTGIFWTLGDWPQAYELKVLANLPQALPIAVFALCGFEAICAVAHLIENPKKNVRRAMLIAFFSVALVSAGFQLGMFHVLGPDLENMKSPMLAYANSMLGHYPMLARAFNAFVYASVLGGSFGMLTSNCWNLQTIAKNGHLPAASYLARVSKKQVPYISLLCETTLASLIIFMQSNQIPLQNMAVFGMTVGYLMSTLAAWRASAKQGIFNLPRWLVALAFASCTYILYLCVLRIASSGASLLFLVLLATGIIIAYFKTKDNVLKNHRC